MGWFDSMAAGAAKTAQAAQQQFPNSYGIDPNQTVMGIPIGQMLQQYNQSQQQQSNPWGATPATPNAVQSGSLSALGGGVGRNAPIYNPVQPPQSGPQPVPGMPPRSFDGPVIGTGFPGPGQPPFDPNVVINGGWGSEGPGGFTGHAQDPGFGQIMQGEVGPYGNRGSVQPINQPMRDVVGTGGPPLQPGDVNYGLAQSFGAGSLQSLGGGQLNQSGMVNLRGPDGSMKAVPQSDMAHWLSKGATMVSGVGNAVRGMF